MTAHDPVTSEPATGPDLLELLREEHRAVEELCAKLASGTGTGKHRTRLTDLVVAELSRHRFLEDRYLYPVARELLVDDPPVADIDDAVRGLWKQGVVTDLLDRVRAHVRTTEGVLFPRLRTACPQVRLAELGQRVREARELAPTRPHAQPPATSLWGRFTAPVLGVADQVRDELTGRCTRVDRLSGR